MDERLSARSAPFLRTLGVRDLEVGDGEASVCLDFDPQRHANGMGIAHGGVVCTLLDIVMGYAAFAWPGRPGPIVTVNQNIAFLGAMRGHVHARGHVVRGGRSMVFCSGEILDHNGALIASGQGVFKKLKVE
ncbi:MAG: PaaI family thioesterase [Variovorax paradoxus]|uniref:PaaI family thioesterase n=1 Tax=Variovorax paradoxus TaxID=34073 RepID=A0A2W5QHR4_VARPD|nr:MAG: PaaI family thioesterase [Variovorax paradoxus]